MEIGVGLYGFVSFLLVLMVSMLEMASVAIEFSNFRFRDSPLPSVNYSA